MLDPLVHFAHSRCEDRFVLIKMQNNGIQTDQLVINNRR